MIAHKPSVLLLGAFLVQSYLVATISCSSDLYNQLQDIKAELNNSPAMDFVDNEIDKEYSLREGDDATNQGGLNKEDLPEMLGLGTDVGLSAVNKRRISVDGGLRSLADMVYAREQARRLGYMSELFRQKGKRSWRFPMLGLNFLKLRTRPVRVDASSMKRRGTNMLSVSGPLSALANMLAEEGNQRKQSESRANRMKLIELGKRSEDKTYTPFEGEAQSELDLDLYR